MSDLSTKLMKLAHNWKHKGLLIIRFQFGFMIINPQICPIRRQAEPRLAQICQLWSFELAEPGMNLITNRLMYS